jgi:Flp pilus assembly protein CpaB
MKQKNLAMLGVAVGCGLVAAVAVAKLSASGSRGQETAKVLVAKRDIPLQTKIEEKDLDNYFAWADLPKNLVPPDAVTDVEQVKGKSLNRTLKQGNALSLTDLGKHYLLDIPEGYDAFTVKIDQVGAVAGFAKPGSRVDIMYVEKTQTGKARAAIILKNMLILAVGMINVLDEKTGAAIPQVESVTLAVTKKQAMRLNFADEKGKVKLMLTGATKEEEAKKINDGDVEWITDPFDHSAPPPKAVASNSSNLEKMVVAKRSVPINTLINADNVNEYFTTTEVKAVPDGVVQNADDLKGKYVVKAVDAGQILFKSLTDNKAIDIENPNTPVPMAPELFVEPVKKLPRYEQVIQEGGRIVRVIWVEVAPSKWKRFDSVKAADEYKPEPEPKADDSKKESPKTDSGE